MLAIKSCLKGRASDWFNMIRDIVPNETQFNKTIFLRYFFSERDTFIKCTKAGKEPVTENFQTHFHYCIEELKYLDSPKMTEIQAMNLVIKHFPIAIQAYTHTSMEKNSLASGKSLGKSATRQQSTKQVLKQTNYITRNTYRHRDSTNKNIETKLNLKGIPKTKQNSKQEIRLDKLPKKTRHQRKTTMRSQKTELWGSSEVDYLEQ